jgi:alpha-beta hydrolase superfamily lysophospholipase
MSTIISAVTLNNPWIIAGIAVAVFLAAGGLVMLFLVPSVIFYYTTYRSPKKIRTRECTNRKDEQQMRMFNEGVQWARRFKDKTEELSIISGDGLTLYGEYINFGYDKCVVILQGRTESLLYSYYFADVYYKNGCNILTVDVRAHGLSDGKYQTGGIKESDDCVLWIKLINEKYGINDFTIHGICIGGATAVFTYVKLKSAGSGLVKRIVTDGVYQSYYEMYKMYFKMFKKPSFPALQLCFFLIYAFTGVRPFKETPLKYMKDIDIPILFIWSEMDIFCTKPKSEELFNMCLSKYKELRFFKKGRHSHVRSTQEAEYDEAIAKFLQKHA